MNNSRFIALLTTVVIVFLSFGCSKPVMKKSNVDTPENHYVIGMQKLDDGDLKTAETEFARALELNKNSPLGYIGMAFVEMGRSNYKSATRHAKKAIAKDRNFADAYAAWGHTIAVRRHGNKWFEESLKHFKKALSIEPENERVLYYLGESYYQADKYEQALEYFTKTVEKKGIFGERANERIAFVEKILKAEPLTGEGKIIAEKAKINRADLCILLIEELKLKPLLKNYRQEMYRTLFREDSSRRNMNINVESEVDNNRAKKWILDIIHLDIPFFNLYPDGRFYPDRLVTKSMMAVVFQWVFEFVNVDSALSTKYIGMASPFDDVNSAYFAFNAVNLCIEKGIMDSQENGFFNPDSPVSGIEAILMIRALENVIPSN